MSTKLKFFYLGISAKTRIIDVIYNASNNELVRTKTLVKNAIVVIDATPFRQWYEGHYALPIGRRKTTKLVSINLILNLTYFCNKLFEPICCLYLIINWKITVYIALWWTFIIDRNCRLINWWPCTIWEHSWIFNMHNINI